MGTKSELNPPPSSMGGPTSLDIKHQPQSPISHAPAYDHHPPSSSASGYSAAAGISTNSGEHDGYVPNSYSSLQTSSSTAYSLPLHHHQGQHLSHHGTHHNSSASSLLGPPMGGDSGV